MVLRPSPPRTRRFGNRVVTEPAVEPVDLAAVKAHLRITDDDSNGYLNTIIPQARGILEQITGIAFITQTWKMTLDNWGGSSEPWWDGVRQGALSELAGTNASIDLPRYPLRSVDTINTYNLAGDATAVVVADTFDIDTNSIRGRMTLKSGAAWPIALRRTNAIEITYTAGYGDAATDVPEPLQRAVLVLVAYLNSHRGNCGMHDAFNQSGAAQLISPWRDKSL